MFSLVNCINKKNKYQYYISSFTKVVEDSLLYLCCETSIILILKADNNITRNKITDNTPYKQRCKNSSQNISHLYPTIKKHTHHCHMAFIQETQSLFNIQKAINTIYDSKRINDKPLVLKHLSQGQG